MSYLKNKQGYKSGCPYFQTTRTRTSSGENIMKIHPIYYMSCCYGLAGLLATTAHAENIPVTFSGFASAGVITGDLNHDFFSGTDVISKSSTFGADNTLGLQISAAMSDQVSMTGQLLAKGTVDSYSVDSHWAYIDYHPVNNLSVRAGRLVLPIVMSSEYVDVGYAYPWIRPPAEVYSGIPMTSYSGVDLLYTLNFDSFNLVFQPYVGSVPPANSIGYQIDVQSGYGLNTTMQFDNGQLRMHSMKVNNIVGTGNSGVFNFAMDAEIHAIGADFEFDNVLLMSEYMLKKFEFSGIPGYKDADGRAWYVTLGYRFGKIMPHITYASADMNKNQMPALQAVMGDLLAQNPALATYLQSNPALMQAFMTDPATALASLDMNDPAVQQLMASLDPALLGSLAAAPAMANMLLPPPPLFYKQDSVTVGVRYDILPKTALKLEYQEIKPKEESWGLFLSDPGNKVQLTSFVIDVTF